LIYNTLHKDIAVHISGTALVPIMNNIVNTDIMDRIANITGTSCSTHTSCSTGINLDVCMPNTGSVAVAMITDIIGNMYVYDRLKTGVCWQ
jgi:hypothetical protein